MSPVNGGRCQDCDATLEWVVTEANSRPMPLDVDPVDNGNVVLVDTPAGRRARVFGRGVTPNVPGARRTSHHATCPARSRAGRDRWLEAKKKQGARR